MTMKKLFLICMALWLCGAAYGQIPKEPVNFQSPNAFQMAKYVDASVNHFTGVPNISVPLYTLQEKNISVPLALNYDASGVRPDEHPGWVGMNFSLSAGGVITRTVNNLPDEFQTWGEVAANNKNGYYFLRARLDPGDWNSLLNTWNQATTLLTAAEATLVESGPLPRGGYDLAPDEFSFSFPGYSGKFYLNQAGQWQVKSDRPLKVVFDNTFLNVPMSTGMLHRLAGKKNFESFSGFTIITEDGTQYKFGGTTDAIEYSIGFTTQHQDHWIANSWYLVKITSPTGEEVDFTYEAPKTLGGDGDNIYEYISQLYVSINFEPIFTVGTCDLRTPTSDDLFSGKLIRPVYLSKIKGKNIELKFSRSTTTELRYDYTKFNYNLNYVFSPWKNNTEGAGDVEYQPYSSYAGLKWKKLDQITVEQNGVTLRTISFQYDNSANERLRLKSVREKGKSTNIEQVYAFDYDESQELPPYLSGKTDHWGFFNGRTSFTGNLFNYSGAANYYADRQPDEQYLYAGILTKITYPTGGYTQFTYEPHYYGKKMTSKRSLAPVAVSNTMAGGLRVKKIVNIDPDRPTEAIEKEYFYVSGYNSQLTASQINALPSSGVLSGQPKYLIALSYTSTSSTYASAQRSSFSSQAFMPNSSNSYGTHVGYTQVIEKNKDNSYTKLTYSNFDNGRLDGDAESVLVNLQLTDLEYLPNNSAKEKRGKLIEQEEMTASNLSVKKTVTDYAALNESTAFVKAMDFKREKKPCGQEGYTWFYVEGISYRLNTYSYLPVKQSTYLYNSLGQNPVKEVREFTYNDERLVIEDKFTDSKGEVILKKIRYTKDMVSLNRDPNGVYDGMTGKNIIGLPIEEVQLKDNKQLSRGLTNYANFHSSFYLPATVQQQKEDTAPLETRVQYDYDKKGNVVSQTLDGHTNTAYVWGYGGIFPIAKINNATYSTIETALGGEAAVSAFLDQLNPTITEVNNFLAPLRTHQSLKSAQVNTYTYRPYIGVRSQRDARGVATYYEYDVFQRLYGIRDHNRDFVRTICYNYANQNVTCTQTRDIDVMPDLEDTGLYECVKSGGLNTGLQARVLKDANPDSPTYGMTQLSSSTTLNTSGCPLPSVIYAKMTYINERTVHEDYDFLEVNHDIKISLFADAACTLPYTTGVNRTLNYKIIKVYIHDFGYEGDWDSTSSETTTNHTITILVGNNSIIIPNVTFYQIESTTSDGVFHEQFTTNYVYELLTGSGYIIAQ